MNRGTAVLALLVMIGAAVIAYQVVCLVGLYLGDIHPSTPVKSADNLHPGPADVSALIEEAKRITGESS